jgi:hypothetical protein
MQSIPRRTALLNMAALATIPAFSASAADEADADLLQLGSRLETLWPKLESACSRFDAISDRVREATEAAGTWPQHREKWTLADFDRYMAVRRAVKKEVGGDEYETVEDAMNALCLECDTIVAAIELAPVTSLAGLGVKARAVMYKGGHWWRRDGEVVPLDDLDIDKRHCRRLIEAICGMAGLPTAPVV